MHFYPAAPNNLMDFFSDVKQGKTDFSGETMRSVDFSSMRLHGFVFDGCNMEGSNLSHADLSRCSFKGSMLTGCNFTGANLSGTDFTGADMDSAILTGAFFDKTNFTKANLTRAHLCRSDLISSDITDAIMTFSCLVDTNVNESQLKSLPSEVLTTIKFSENSDDVRAYGAVTKYNAIDGKSAYSFNPGHYDGHSNERKKNSY